MNIMWYDSLKEKKLFENFSSVSSVPRSSGKEDGIRAFLLKWANENGIEAETDAIGNVIMRKPATKGKESVPSICLQGHMDMVCVKRDGSKHDFDKDPIDIVLKDGFVTAKDTSLGADNGIAIAMAMTLFTEDFPHGPIEALFTVNEEVGLTGAMNVDERKISSRYLINLDSEEEGIIYTGCAGGRDTIAEKAIETAKLPKDSVVYELTASGLLGGHSGGEIHKQRANANKVLARIMRRIPEYMLISFEGGTRRNVIPSLAKAVFAIKKDDEETMKGIVATASNEIKDEYSISDPDVETTLKKSAETPDEAITKEISGDFIKALYLAPDGMERMSLQIPGIVETSNNIGIVSTADGKITCVSSSRSLRESAKMENSNKVSAAFEAYGFTVTHDHSYPAWTPNSKSVITEKVRNAYKDYFKKDPVVTCIHAGLECGIINAKIPGMDSVSIGPDLFDVHSVNEKLRVSSAESTLGFLRHLLSTF